MIQTCFQLPGENNEEDCSFRKGRISVFSAKEVVLEPITSSESSLKENGSRGLYLHWEGKRLYRQLVPTPRILEPVTKLSVGDTADNLIVEGDNLQVLASLKPRYAGQVDVIYVDPPYNTGKDDFRYSDKRFHDPDADDSDTVYVSNEDGGRHTKWLNFMAPRLYMMWEMLNEDRGVIFVSINDIELFRLGLLLNEIFGEEHWIGTVVWHGNTDNNPTRIAIEHEYILCYAKNKERQSAHWTNQDTETKTMLLDAFDRIKKEKLSLPAIKKSFAAFAKDNRAALGDLYRYRHVDKNGPYAPQRNVHNPGKPGHKYDVIHPVTKKPCTRPFWGWRFPEKTMDELRARGLIIFGQTENKIPELKVYLAEVGFPFRSVVNMDSRKGSNDLARLFDTRDVFKNPKPVELMDLLLGYTTTRESVVLDVFAGSGTTAESVLRLNQHDKGVRRFILIEDGRGKNGTTRFTRTVTAKRVKLAIEQNKYDDGFTFLTTGRKLDRSAIVGLERDALANLICQADETGRGRGIARLSGYQYIIGKNPRGEGICLVWKGAGKSEVTPKDLKNAATEVSRAGLKRPFRMYGTFCRVADVATSWRFCQIPDEILAQMHVVEDVAIQEAS
jgi:adenine-specific DNA-methyltransferase